ncbi:C40 family peptidase [Mucilaginibacter polytrichastri]|uniref:Putative endopeptidase NlpC-like protein n=1 Tax=Mucilaginibacter polytrichastri TaxID=1302689 RepID=A0A1Q5ZZ34_9SPHI|nr:C40 family peptidase [Mucilaginibacter polytrichastri]OKS87034.1 putative endopeptidase NlpC-like protein [Mucilaginibacter polytrichastri]SFS86270.1 lipoprotein Spr [Mucilaginibacter polytrichastri]
MITSRTCKLVFILFAAVFLITSCKSKKAVLKGSPGEVVKPQGFIADKYAEIMGVDKSSIQNGRLYNFIEEWSGTPYRFGGLDKNGVDCSGLAYLLEQQVFGINIPRMTSQQINVIKRKYEDELQEGDLVFFDFDGKKFSHVGVYLQNGYVVHASTRRGVIIIKLRDPSMYKYFSRAGSIMSATTADASGAQ